MDALKDVLKKAVQAIRSGMLRNEAQVKQSVILPILRELGYDDASHTEFVPEFSLNDGRVDYALIHRGSPLVLIEAKRLGNVTDQGEEQVFRYAVNNGVPFLILTDGDIWNFYLSMAAGPPVVRRFYRMALRNEGNIPRYAEFFEKYLKKETVFSGEARRKAEELHESNQAREKARDAIPQVWRDLLSTPDDLLRDLLIEAVESNCGTRPELDDVGEFLLSQISSDGRQPVPDTETRSPVPTPAQQNHANTDIRTQQRRQPEQRARRSGIVGFILDGEEYKSLKGIQTLIKILNVFQVRDSNFMERFAPNVVGRTRRLVSQNREYLYRGREDLMLQYSVRLENGWWLGSNISSREIKNYIRTACEVAGVGFGRQLQLIEE